MTTTTWVKRRRGWHWHSSASTGYVMLYRQGKDSKVIGRVSRGDNGKLFLLTLASSIASQKSQFQTSKNPN
jgi:hypothetical protein